MTSTEEGHQPWKNDDCPDDSLSDFIPTNRYFVVQGDLEELYSSMQELVVKDEFKMHIQKDAFDMDKIEEKLRKRKNDVMKTECPIVIAGETSSGKSSIINLILGEKILPSGITASTSRVCRVKYFKRCMISTRDNKDEELENMSFDNSKEMAEKLKTLALTNDTKISYLDIYMPVPLLQGNVIIVDTPGFGDQEHKDVADKMMSYLPNALSFVFVLNVSNAGGMQDDRLIPVLSKVRDSMDGMVSFSPEDVIFLLNKWDTISHEDVEQQETFFLKAKECLHQTWKELDDSCIFKFSAKKVLKKKAKYIEVFHMFERVLKQVIGRNENKRVKVHLGFLKTFLEECNRVLSSKLLNAEQSDTENQTKLDILSLELENIEATRKEELSNIECRINTFLDKASDQLHEYLNHPHFKVVVLENTSDLTRFSIAKELNYRIEVETTAWQERHIDDIFQETIMGDLIEKYENLQKSLHSIKENLKGFKTPFDVDNKVISVIASGVLSSGAGLLGSFLVKRVVSDPAVLFGIASAGIVGGLVISGLVAFDVVDDFDTVRQNAFKARINAFTKEKLKGSMRKRYVGVCQKIIKAFLEGELEKEIIKIKENISTLRKDHDTFKSEKETLSLLRSTVTEKIKHLEKLEITDIHIE